AMYRSDRVRLASACVLAEPGGKFSFEVAGAFRIDDPSSHSSFMDDEEGRKVGDAESFGEIRAVIDADTHDVEGVVVLAALHCLGDEAFGAAAAPRARRVEDGELRPFGGRAAGVVFGLGTLVCHLF